MAASGHNSKPKRTKPKSRAVSMLNGYIQLYANHRHRAYSVGGMASPLESKAIRRKTYAGLIAALGDRIRIVPKKSEPRNNKSLHKKYIVFCVWSMELTRECAMIRARIK